MTWQLSHGIKVWTGPLPDARTCLDCEHVFPEGTNNAVVRCGPCQKRHLAPPLPRVKATPQPARLCVCGCLVAHGEDCPNCRVWARAAEAVWNRERRAA